MEEIDSPGFPDEPVVLEEESTIDFIDDSKSRFKGALWFDWIKDKPLTIGGCGGINSWTCIPFARMGCKLILYDFDTVEVVNLAGQSYDMTDINLPKVHALKNKLIKLTDNTCDVETNNIKFDAASTISDICISGFDNMLARKNMFNAWRTYLLQELTEEERADCIFIDGRLRADMYQIFCIRGSDEESIQLYMNEHLFDDSEVEEGACTFKQTTHMAMMIAGHMATFLSNFAAERSGHPFTVPFFTEYQGNLNYYV